MASIGSSSSIAEPEAEPARPSDVVVGIASFNDAATIGLVVRSVREGMERHLGAGGCIVLADGGSTDETLDRAQAELAGGCEAVAIKFARPDIDPLKTPYHGRPGRAAAIRAVLRAAQDRHAKACAMLDAGLADLMPEWFERLLEPALRGEADYVSAFYLRSPYEGAITKSIVYPVFRALYGARLRQPAAPEFACSANILDHYLAQRFWQTEEAYSGIDLWLATSAASGGYRLGEAVLGVRAFASHPGAPDLSTAFGQLVGALLSDLEARAHAWQRARPSVPVPVFGVVTPSTVASTPHIEAEGPLESFRLGYRALRDVWAWVLPPRTILDLKRLTDASAAQFRMDDDLWARIIYDFALAYRMRTMPHDHLLGALTPLYLGWLASFILEPGTSDSEYAERRIDRLCLAFEAQKSYLISRWRWPERFRP
jgi:hypothetical protein